MIVRQAPTTSAIYRSLNPQAIPLDVEFLRAIEHGTRILAWQQTKDGSKGIGAPKPITLPGDEPDEDVEVVGRSEGFDNVDDLRDWYRAQFSDN